MSEDIPPRKYDAHYSAERDTLAHKREEIRNFLQNDIADIHSVPVDHNYKKQKLDKMQVRIKEVIGSRDAKKLSDILRESQGVPHTRDKSPSRACTAFISAFYPDDS